MKSSPCQTEWIRCNWAAEQTLESARKNIPLKNHANSFVWRNLSDFFRLLCFFCFFLPEKYLQMKTVVLVNSEIDPKNCKSTNSQFVGFFQFFNLNWTKITKEIILIFSSFVFLLCLFFYFLSSLIFFPFSHFSFF